MDMMTLGPTISGLNLLHRGKVRDTYEVTGRPDLLLVVASDRISVFDFVLNATVPGKGEILTAMNVFWARKLSEYNHDLVAFGSGIDRFLPEALRGNAELQKRAVVVLRATTYPIELIVRGYLTGSGLEAYLKTHPHMVCGHTLPEGLGEASQLPRAIFTPNTKAKTGHDQHITFGSVNAKYGTEIGEMALDAYSLASAYTRTKGIIIADTKFEMGRIGSSNSFIDERLTPDSSRFWEERDWQLARREARPPKPFDKQRVRDHAKTLGINKMEPENPEDYAWVREQVIPSDVIEETVGLYHKIFERLTELSVKSYQLVQMGV